MVLVLTCHKARSWWWLKTLLSSLSKAPFSGSNSLAGLWWVILWGDSPESHSVLFPFPCQLSWSQVGVFSNVLCISWDPPPRESRSWVLVWRPPPKMPNLLVLAGSQGCYAYLKESLWYLSVPDWDCEYTEYICWIFDSAKFVFSRGKTKLKYYVGSVNMDISLMPKDKQ